MARAAEVKKKALADLRRAAKEIEATEEDDLGKLAEEFDSLSQMTDEVANVFAAADEALGGKKEKAA